MRSSILPTSSSDAIQTIVPRRYLKVAIYILCAFCVLTTVSFFSDVAWDDVQVTRNWSPFTQQPPQNNKPPAVSLADSPNYPPDYAEWHEIEEALPQHNENLTFPEGKEGRYVYFSEHVKSKFILIQFPTCILEDSASNYPILQQRRGGGTYYRSISSRDCWPTLDEDRA